MSEICERLREKLDSYAVELTDIREIDQEHLRTCPSCAAAFWQNDVLRRALRTYSDEIECAATAGLEDELMSRLADSSATAPVLQAVESPSPGNRRKMRSGWTPAAAIAATLLLSLLGLWQIWPEKTNPSARDALLAAVERESSDERIVQYLNRSQFLLFSLWDSAEDCDDGLVSIETEREMAQGLVFQKRLLDSQLAEPGYEDLQRLCNELEMIILDVASSDNCIDAEQIDLWRQVLQSRSTLLKLNLLRSEAAT